MSKKALVVGLKRSGLAAINILKENNYKVVVTINNSMSEKERTLLKDIVVYENGHPFSLLDENWDFIIKNPGIPYRLPFIQRALEKNIKILNEVELAYMFYENTYFAITGTNGKTTTTTLIYEIFNKAFNNVLLAGNIGIALSDVIVKHKNDNLVILELSNFQLMGLVTFKPKVATILNLTPDHLDYMKSLEEYYISKLTIYKNQDENDFFIYNEDDENIRKYVKNVKAKIIKFSSEKESDVYLKDNWIYYYEEKVIDINKLQVIGAHNIKNIMVALIYAKVWCIKDDIIKEVVYNFKGVDYRLQRVEGINNNIYYNDSKSTTAESTITAIQAINKQDTILILGGFDKKLDYSEMIDVINESKDITCVLTFGMIKDKFSEINKNLKVFNNLEEVVLYLKENVSDKTILFSPATSSYDQFEDFEQRGLVFNTLIRG